MSNIDRAADIIEGRLSRWEVAHYEPDPHKLAQSLADAGLIAPEPQIIRTPAELEALDPECLVYDSTMMFWQVQDAYAYNEWGEVIGREGDYISDLPVVVVAPADQVRACREALEGETP